MAADGPAASVVRRTTSAGPDVRIAGYRWSPDGSRIAVLETDQREVPLRGIPDYLSDETRLVSIRRPYPGEEPVGQRIGVVDATLGDRLDGGIEWIEPMSAFGGKADIPSDELIVCS